MGISCKYTVAGHTFAITLPEGLSPQELLQPYEPFASDASDVLFELSLEYVEDLAQTVPGKVVKCLNDEAPYFWIFDNDGLMSFGFSYTKDRPDCILKVSPDYRYDVVYMTADSGMAEFAINNAAMLLYTFCTAPYQTLMVHASVIRRDGEGYMFLGRSGTGKSTHSRLWLKHVNGSVLLNDDNPVVRVVDSLPYVYGTPWSGKTKCYKNEVVPLKAVVRLSQAPHNKISRLAPLQSFASLLPACSCMRWDSASVTALHKTVERVIAVVPGYQLECLPDEKAALLCHSTVCR